MARRLGRTVPEQAVWLVPRGPCRLRVPSYLAPSSQAVSPSMHLKAVLPPVIADLLYTDAPAAGGGPGGDEDMTSVGERKHAHDDESDEVPTKVCAQNRQQHKDTRLAAFLSGTGGWRGETVAGSAPRGLSSVWTPLARAGHTHAPALGTTHPASTPAARAAASWSSREVLFALRSLRSVPALLREPSCGPPPRGGSQTSGGPHIRAQCPVRPALTPDP